MRTRAKRTTGKQGLRYTPKPEAPHYVAASILSPGQALGWHRRANAQKRYDDELLPCPEDRPLRAELSTIRIKYAFKISIQFWSRRDNSVVPLA